MNNLNLLALYANEKYLYLNIDHKLTTINDVQVNVIRYDLSNKSHPHNRDYEVIVRVSTITCKNRNVTEIMWEGPLQDWYAACAKAVFNATHYIKEESNE